MVPLMVPLMATAEGPENVCLAVRKWLVTAAARGPENRNPLSEHPERGFAVRKGLEPSTSGVTGRHSNQLNYRTRLVAYS